MNNATSIIIVIICFVKVFVNPTKSLEISKTQNNEAVEMIKDDEMCYLCHEEKLTVKFLPCLHKIGNECASRLFAYGHKYCPLCKTEIMMLSNYVDKGICYRCEDEKLTVTFKPCGHKIGNNCAYRMHVLNQKSCPFCENYINEFENLYKPNIPALNKPDIELCVCCTEKTSRTVQPCNHLVGYECGSIIDDADIISCPICNVVITNNTVNQNQAESPNTYSEPQGYFTEFPTPYPVDLRRNGTDNDNSFGRDDENYGLISSTRDINSPEINTRMNRMALSSEVISPIILSHYQTPFSRGFSTDSPDLRRNDTDNDDSFDRDDENYGLISSTRDINSPEINTRMYRMALSSEIISPIILSHYQTPFSRGFSTDSPDFGRNDTDNDDSFGRDDENYDLISSTRDISSSYRTIGDDRLDRIDIGVSEYIHDEENDITKSEAQD